MDAFVDYCSPNVKRSVSLVVARGEREGGGQAGGGVQYAGTGRTGPGGENTGQHADDKGLHTWNLRNFTNQSHHN